MNRSMWKDGILVMLRAANRAFDAGEAMTGLALLTTAMEATRQLPPRRFGPDGDA